jgi:LysR family transcriptional activator of nhaA
MSPMEWLNYHHLYYFWLIAQEGTLSKAAARLRLTHSTLSAQLRQLEDFLGQPLFDRRGRRLSLTPFGAEVAHYAAEIFQLGGELVEVARGRRASRRARLRVGVVGTLPRTIVYRLLEPALAAEEAVTAVIIQAPFDQLLVHLAANRLQLVLADRPPPEGGTLGLHTHLLGGSEILLYGTPALAARYRRGFPGSLDGAALVVPGGSTGLRRAIERWFADRTLRFEVAAEVDDAGLMRVFGAFGRGLFPIRAVLRTEVEETHEVSRVGPLDGIEEKYYAIALERRVRDPRVARIITSGRTRLSRRAPGAEWAGTRSRGVPGAAGGGGGGRGA